MPSINTCLSSFKSSCQSGTTGHSLNECKSGCYFGAVPKTPVKTVELTSGRGHDSRLDKLERCTIGGDERLILGHVFRDLGLAIGPVVKAGKIPEERRVVSRRRGAIKRQRGCLPGFVGDHSALERVPLEMQMALRFGICGCGVIHCEPFLVGAQVQILSLEF